MDGNPTTISSHDLYACLGTAAAPLLLDVRRPDAFGADDKLIMGAVRRAPAEVDGWLKKLPFGHPAVVYCAHGGGGRPGVGEGGPAAGIEAAFLAGGIAGWAEQGRAARKNL